MVTYFLNLKLDSDVYMEVSEGMSKLRRKSALSKALLGLKQAPKPWNENLGSLQKELGIMDTLVDVFFFVKSENREPVRIMAW